MYELTPYLRLLWARSGRLLLGAALLLITTLAGAGLLALSGWFITATAAAAAASATSVVAFQVYVPGGAIRGFALGRTAARYGERLHNHDAVLRILADLRSAVFMRLARLDVRTLARLRSSDLLSRLTADIDALDALYLRVLAPPLVALLGITAVTALIGWFVPWLGVGVGGLLLALWLALVLGGWGAGARPSERLVAGTQALRERVLEQVEGLAELLCFGTLARHRRFTEDQRRQRAAQQRRLATRQALGDALATAGIQLAGVLALIGGIVAHQRAGLPVAVVVLMALVPLGLGELLGALPGGFIQLGRSRAAARRLNDQLRASPTVCDPATPQSEPTTSELAFDAVHYRYNAYAPPVLAGVDLTLAAGERVVVTGRSGSGKSTLAALALRRMDPDAGHVRLGGVRLDALALPTVRRRVAYLTQDTELVDGTVAANLRIADRDADDGALYRALAVAGLATFVEELPRGLATRVGQGGSQLSGGQARRLALARVVLRDPGAVILDEPLAGLDAATAAAVTQSLDAWLGHRTVLALGHDAAALPITGRVLHLSHGHLQAV